MRRVRCNGDADCNCDSCDAERQAADHLQTQLGLTDAEVDALVAEAEPRPRGVQAEIVPHDDHDAFVDPRLPIGTKRNRFFEEEEPFGDENFQIYRDQEEDDEIDQMTD